MDVYTLLSIPKSIIINLKLFDWHIAVKLPVLVSYKTKFRISKGSKIELKGNESITSGMIRIGFGGSDGILPSKSHIKICNGGSLAFIGRAFFSQGISIIIMGGSLTVGDNFYCNKNCFISCDKSVSIDKDSLFGYEVSIRDGDGHYIGKKLSGRNVFSENTRDIKIGKHVWICSKANILKGTTIFDDSVVGYAAVVSGKIEGNEASVVLAGNPAKIIRKDIVWKK